MKHTHNAVKSSRAIETVFFDAMGTLFGLSAPVGEIYAREARRFGFAGGEGRKASEELQSRFYAVLQQTEPLLFPGCSPAERWKLEKNRWRQIVMETFRDADFPRVEEYFEHVHSFFSTPEPWRLEPGVPEILKSLRHKGCSLGVISNFDSRLEAVLEVLGIRRYFSTVTVSSVVGAEKPSREIFEAALKAASTEAGAALHVGDNLDADYRGARHSGLEAILYDPGQQHRADDLRRIGHFAEMAGFLL